MAIKATVDSKSYSGIENIEVGGKIIALEETYTGTKTITSNGNYDVSGYANAEVNVPTEGESFTLQEKTVTQNGEVTPDSGYDGLSKVTVNVPSSGGGESAEKSVVTFDGSIQGILWANTMNPTGVKVAHGLGKVPKYAIISSDAIADGTLKGVVIGGAFIGDTKAYNTAVSEGRKVGFLIGSNVNTGASAGYVYAYDDDEEFLTTGAAQWFWDEEYIYILKPANNQNFHADINYTLTCYA